jgi:hypothetical protein
MTTCETWITFEGIMIEMILKDNIKKMDTWIDLNTQTYYEVKQSWEQKGAQDVINGVLEKENQRKELIVNWIKNDLINTWWTIEATNSSHFWVYKNIWLQVYKELDYWHLYKYSEQNWFENYSWLNGIFWDEYIVTYAKEAWYDIKDKSIYKYEKEIALLLQNWEINSKYIEALSNISFYQNMWMYWWMMKTIIEWWKLKWSLKYIDSWIISWAVRIKDIVFFAWKWYIEEKEIPKLLKRAIQELPNQSSDTRFYKNASWLRMWMEVTKQELSQYLKPKEWEAFITQKMYDQCIKLIDIRDELIRKKEEAKESTKWNLKIEKEKKWIINKVYDLLGW